MSSYSIDKNGLIKYVTIMADIIKTISNYDPSYFDSVINEIYRELPQRDALPIAERVELISRRFVGKPYCLGALGEGRDGEFDQSPLYRTDAFDCVTFVNTVLALALSNTLTTFQNKLKHLNYRNGQVAYQKRLHFISADWNPGNAEAGYIKDITREVATIAGQPYTVTLAKALIDRPSWFMQRSLVDIKLLQPVKKSYVTELLESLHNFSKEVAAEEVATPYLPLSALFNEAGKANQHLFEHIPSGCVLEIVRPDWDLSKEIGTHLNISHVGFAIRHSDDELIYREASSIHKRVIDVPLVDYLRDRIGSPTIKGINIQSIIG